MKEQLIYENPIIHADYSDPDVISADGRFYMVSSSFNFLPGVPVLRSENLVEWEIVGHVIKKMPFERFENRVCRGDGAWAPSIRFHGGKYYCLIPFPDDGVFVSEADSPEGEWSPLRPIIAGKGIIDPCPVWADGRCYVVVAFAKSRTGFNSVLGLYEVTPDLTSVISDGYKIIYDGHADNPTIEGPKFYRRGEWFYILAPAGSVKSGWQVALRSKSVYGPYESKIILMQGDTLVNGPHQGALVTAPDGSDWFVHFQDMRAYGRIIHLQPVKWCDGWPLCGKVEDERLAGTPVKCGAYPVKVKTGAAVRTSDDFSGEKLSPMWQTPANMRREWYALGGGLTLFCVEEGRSLEDMPNAFTTMVPFREFSAQVTVTPRFIYDGDEAGFGILGAQSAYLRLFLKDGERFAELYAEGESLFTRRICADECVFKVIAGNSGIYNLDCTFSIGGEELSYKFTATAGDWVGARIALFARNAVKGGGKAVFTNYKVEKF